jgi:hypothetical protein
VKLVVFDGEDFGYWKNRTQLSSESGSHHLVDHTRGVRDPRYTRPCDPR